MPKTLKRPKVVDTETPAPKKRSRPSGRKTKRFGLPVRDAEQPLILPLLQVDIDKAQAIKPDDVNDTANFMTCVIAQAVTRGWGTERVAILRRHAYVAFPGDGHTKRYEVDPSSQAVLAAWDRGEHVAEGIELRLRAPAKSRTLAAMRRQNRKWLKAQQDTTKPKSKRKQQLVDPLHHVVRNGNLVRWS